MITADQILCHLIGDYILQSDWMATEKTKKSLAALAHVITYSLPFLFFRPSWSALLFIAATHFVIDRWRLARYVVWAKNFLGPRRKFEWEEASPYDMGVLFHYEERWVNPPWPECSATGYWKRNPTWLSTWLLIIADNTLHLICNGLALTYL